MLEKISNDKITKALKKMEVQENNNMIQEFIEGLRNGRPNGYVNLRVFISFLSIDNDTITTEAITEVLQRVGSNTISKMREEIFNAVTGKEYDEYQALRKFFSKFHSQ